MNHQDDELSDRLGLLEQKYAALQQSLQRVEMEQSHVREIINSRFDILGKQHDLLLAKFEAVSDRMTQAIGDADKSPMGRSLSSMINGVGGRVTQCETDVEDLARWQTRVDGVLMVLKFMGAGGLAALVLVLLRMMKALP